MSVRALLCSRKTAIIPFVKSFSTSAVRKAHAPPGSGVYRADAPPCDYGPKIRVMKACQVLVWWHIFYSFWYDPEIILGHPEYELPNISLWTDEELGIPPDDYDEVV